MRDAVILMESKDLGCLISTGGFERRAGRSRREITDLCLQSILSHSNAGIHTRSKMYRRIEFGGNFVEKEKRE